MERIADYPVLDAQYLQSAITIWRNFNPWASEIRFVDFPQKYKDAVLVAAEIMQNAGVE
jgi:hypothetical protein